jgi:hypothetical protein
MLRTVFGATFVVSCATNERTVNGVISFSGRSPKKGSR